MTAPILPGAGAGPQVRYARLSLGWFALNVAALAGSAAEQNWRWGRSLAWRNNFGAIRDGKPAPLADRRLTPPWDGSNGEALWSHYAWGSSNRRTSVRSAWANVFPVRVAPPARLAGSAGWRGVIHDLVYPHGVGCLVDLSFLATTPLPFADFCDATATLRNAQHIFTGLDVPVGRFDDIADDRLNRTAGAAFGGPPDIGPPGFSVCTIISGVPHGTPTVTGLRLASSALIHGLGDWRTAQGAGMTGPVPVIVSSTTAQMFSGSAGRWSFSPALLAGGSGMAEFHRAMMWMSLQVDALGSFAKYLTAKDLGELPPSAYGLRRPVGMALGRLRGGAGPVPPSTVVRQLQDRGFADAVAEVRAAEQLD